jgi:lipoprotein-anchoring transpeptidase ErfK/SrfK
MIRYSAAFLLPLAALATAVPAAAQYNLPPPGVYQERLPPVMGANDDDYDTLPPPGRGRAQRRNAERVLPYPDDEPSLPPPTGLFGTPDRAPPGGYGHQLEAQQPPPGVAPPRVTNDPDVVRPPGAIGAAPGAAPQPAPQTGQAASGTSVMSLPPEDQPETGKPKELPTNLKKQLVDYPTREPAGTLVIDTPNTYLYLVLGGGKALRYGIGVGREGFTWTGTERISRMKEWPDWFPPSEMIDRQPYLPRMMAGGPGNPLGARALYLGHTLYRIHGTNQPSTIGSFVSSGCIRLLNEDIEDLYSRVQVGTRVVVMPGGKPPEHVANTAAQPAANGPLPAGGPTNIAPAHPGAGGSAAISSSPLPPVR